MFPREENNYDTEKYKQTLIDPGGSSR